MLITFFQEFSFYNNPANPPLIRYLIVAQVNYSVSNFLSASLIPEIASNVAAGAAGDIQLVLVTVTTIWALPHQLAIVLHDLDLAVIAAALAVVGLGV